LNATLSRRNQGDCDPSPRALDGCLAGGHLVFLVVGQREDEIRPGRSKPSILA
jgi:hypothetical protein